MTTPCRISYHPSSARSTHQNWMLVTMMRRTPRMTYARKTSRPHKRSQERLRTPRMKTMAFKRWRRIRRRSRRCSMTRYAVIATTMSAHTALVPHEPPDLAYMPYSHRQRTWSARMKMSLSHPTLQSHARSNLRRHIPRSALVPSIAALRVMLLLPQYVPLLEFHDVIHIIPVRRLA